MLGATSRNWWLVYRTHGKWCGPRLSKHRRGPVSLYKGDRVCSFGQTAHKFAYLPRSVSECQPLCQWCWHMSSWATSTGCHLSFSNRLLKCPKEIPGPVDNLEPLEVVTEKCNRNEGETSRAEASSVTVSGELNVDGRRVGIPSHFSNCRTTSGCYPGWHPHNYLDQQEHQSLMWLRWRCHLKLVPLVAELYKES